jgi:PadR family transcriptional regulator PadR
MRFTSLASGTLYPLVYALEEAGLLNSRWEAESPQSLGRPRRRLYKITALGEQVARAEGADLAPLIPTRREA